jgi:NAD(P)-dependent dehydrogenase (short-subunit alcohol dehydrogenase family)
MPLRGLEGKVVVVTGGASGIGRAVVERLLEEGSSVAFVDRDQALVDALTEQLATDRALGVVADVTAEDETERYYAEALERFGHVDGLHANAGIAEPGPTVAETDMTSYDRIMAVNVRGVFLAVRRHLRQLAAQKTTGSIVTTSSVIGIRGLPGSGSYCASKAAVIGLTRAVAMEAGPDGHRVNAVLPGPISTPMADRIREDQPAQEQARFAQRLVDVVPLARMGEASEVASLVAWLLSEESSYVTGAVYSVDGGQAAG